MRGDGRIFQRGQWLWIGYYRDGKELREPARDKIGKRTNDEKIAAKYLKSRTDQLATERGGGPAFITPQSRRVTVRDLLEALKAKFELEGQLSPQNKSHLKRADQDFGAYRAVALTSELVEEYKKDRLDAGDKKASINRPLELVRQACKLAIRRKRIAHMPYIELFAGLNNARKGFCEEPEFRRIHSFLPDYLQDFALFGYCVGMRLAEIRSLKWEFVRGDVIELQGEDAKGDGGEDNARLIPMVGRDLAGILERRRAARQIKTESGTTIASLIFHHNGKGIGDIRKAWQTAVIRAGAGKMICQRCKSQGPEKFCPECKTDSKKPLKRKFSGRIFHDLRRSFCKNADEAGLSRDVARSLSGHKTDATYTRYNICDVKRKRKGLELVQEYRDAQAAQPAPESNLVAMR